MKYPDLAKKTQSDPLDERQVQNQAGGYTYALDEFGQLARFLVLGSDKPTYYASAKKMTLANTDIVKTCWRNDHRRTGDALVSYRNRAPKLDAILYALALGFASDNLEARKVAGQIFPKIVTNASHLFSFTKAVLSLRGTGRAVVRAMAQFYESRTAEQLAYQMIKYRERAGYDHRKLLEMSHPRVTRKVEDKQIVDQDKGALFRQVRARDSGKDLPRLHDREHTGTLPLQYKSYLRAKDAGPKEIVRLIEDHKLPWEAIPTDKVRIPEVQEALIPGMPLNAFVRQLGLLSSVGVLTRAHMNKLRDSEAVNRSRLHPFSVLTALSTYKQGRGERTTWPVHQWVLKELNDLFYVCFAHVPTTGKRVYIGLDVSGSMGVNHVQGSNLTAREAAAAMSMVTVSEEDHCDVRGFSHRMIDLPIHSRMALEDVIRKTENIPFGRTDCALPMLDALGRKEAYDAFVIYTDNETWAGNEHPVVALQRYRQKFIGDAKLIVVGMTATRFTIADPRDPGMLDVVGFDSAAPQLIADFICG